MHTHKLYTSWLRLPNGLIAETDAGLCLLGEDGVLALDELPPAAYEYDKRKKPLFGKPKEPWRRPAADHLATPLACAYRSRTDTLYFWQNGACACLLHAVPDVADRSSVRFYTPAEAQELGLTAEAIAANALYQPLALEPRRDPSAFPLVQSHIVSPGLTAATWEANTPLGYAAVPGFASVDFVRDSTPNRAESAAFAAMPLRFAELIGAEFDSARWQAAMEDEDGPPFLPDKEAIFTLIREGKRVAELVVYCVAYADEDMFPYHDSLAFVLQYAPEFQGAVDALVEEMCAAHRNLLPVSPQLCHVVG